MKSSALINSVPTHLNLGFLPFVLLGLFAIAVPLAVGAGVAGGVWLIAATLTFLVPLLILNVLLLTDSNRRLWNGVLWLEIGLLLGLPLILKITGKDFSFLLELVLLAVTPALIPVFFRLIRQSRDFRWVVFFLAVFMSIAVLSSIFGRSHLFAATFQAATNVKFLIILLLGVAVSWTQRSELMFWMLVRWMWPIQILMVGWQWAHQGSYFSVFWGAPYISPDPLGLFPSRALGSFQHPSFLAAVSIFFFIACWLRYLNENGRGNLMLSVIYFSLLVASTERQELAGALFVGGGAWIFKVRSWRLLFAGTFLICAFAVGGTGIWHRVTEKTIDEARHWGLVGHERIDHPRAVLFLTAASVADEYFPLGSGLGTYGGAGSQKFDASFIEYLGFNRYWWFMKKNFLMDTYWPNFIAESGWFGFLAMLCCITSLIRVTVTGLVRSTSAREQWHWGVAVASMVYMSILSLTSSAIQNPAAFLLPGAFIGIALSSSERWLDDLTAARFRQDRSS